MGKCVKCGRETVNNVMLMFLCKGCDKQLSHKDMNRLIHKVFDK